MEYEEGLFQFRRKQVGLTMLVPSFQVQVQGNYNGQTRAVNEKGWSRVSSAPDGEPRRRILC